MLGLPCAICLSVTGFVFLVTGIGILSSESEFDGDFFDDHDEPLTIVGIVMMIIGGVFIAACIWLCYAAHRAYKSYTAGSEGRVISTTQTVSPPPGSYPVASSIAYQYPPGTQITTYATTAAPPAGYVASSQIASYPAPGQYPSAAPGQPGLYQLPAGGQQGPYPVQPGSYQAQVAGQPGQYPQPVGAYQPTAAGLYQGPYPGQQPAPPYLSQYAPEAPGLPHKGAIPGEVTPSAPHDPYEKPPPYAP